MNRSRKKKIVIIKTGHSETLVNDPSQLVVSLGDILRCTPLIEHFSGHELTWVCSTQGAPLIENISQLTHTISPESFFKMNLDSIDILINLEQGFPKVEINSETNFLGFDFDKPELIHTPHEIISLIDLRRKLNKLSKPTFQDFIFHIIGQEFNSESYKISPNFYSKQSEPLFDVGLNWKVGKKWPTKEVPKETWLSIEEKLKSETITTSWQEGFSDLSQYISWIQSNKVIITNDSLCLHISLALKKPTICFFGPTSDLEVHSYDLLLPVYFEVPDTYQCLPCYSRDCSMDICCTSFINLKNVLNITKTALNKQADSD